MPQNGTCHPFTTKSVVLIAFDGVEVLDIAGPASIFSKANAKQPGSYQISILADRQGEIHTNSGFPIVSHGSWRSIEPQSIDTLIVASGPTEIVQKELVREDLVDWIKTAAATARRMVCIYTGVYALGRANLLEGRRCATHWAHCDHLRSHFPNVELVRDRIFVRDGNIWSCGGIMPAMDLALALVEDDLGRECAVDIARTLVLPGIRPGTAPQVSTLLDSQARPRSAIRELLPWIQQNLSKDLRAETLADKVSMSVRNFNRVFTREIGMTPHAYVLAMRLEYAASLLIETDWGIDDIARECGFVSTDSLQRGFRKRWDVSPSVYRNRK
ncbi:GlxA family transcriptional regulator [Achromobacter aloeverae]